MSSTLLTALLTLIPLALTQTFTSCNPLNSTCPPNAALSTTYTFTLTNSSLPSSAWNITAKPIDYTSTGAAFTITQPLDSPTISSRFHIFGGEVEVFMRAAPGQGVCSSIVLQSDDLDEVDWELIGTNNTHVQSNYFGKGNTTSYDRAIWHPVSNPQTEFHNYTTRWTREKLEWFIDGTPVRVLEAGDADNEGKNYPQSPMNVRLGVWPAGDKNNNEYTVEWAGGETDYDKGPFTMLVQSIRVTDFSSGKEYKYGDRTGSWDSIVIVPGNSTIAQELNRPPPMSVAQRWDKMSNGAKAGIGGSVGVTCVVLILAAGWYCVRQRRAGRTERIMADQLFEKEAREMMAYREMMGKGGFAVSSREVR